MNSSNCVLARQMKPPFSSNFLTEMDVVVALPLVPRFLHPVEGEYESRLVVRSLGSCETCKLMTCHIVDVVQMS